MQYWFKEKQPPDHLDEILALPPPDSIWFNYALSTNQRGKVVAQHFSEYFPARTKRYLDVGCAYGGCLRAFAEFGFNVLGFEIDPQLIELGKANCADAGMLDCIVQASLLDDDLLGRLGGQFDVITCMAVLEHVLDVPKALKNLDHLLNPGGVLVIEIPSPTSLNCVSFDIHYNFFGLILLDRTDAIRYHQCFYTNEYDVGYILDYSYYIEGMERLGYVCKLIESTIPMPGFRNVYKIFRSMRGFLAFIFGAAWKLPLSINLKLIVKYIQFILHFMLDTVLVIIHKMDKNRFKLKYFADAWFLVFEKRI
jgi:SAM-dependent methyltransferase